MKKLPLIPGAIIGTLIVAAMLWAADITIPDLVELAGGSVDPANDLLIIEDVSAGASGTKKIKVASLLDGGGLGSTDAVTFSTLDTGQGANELYDMDQNVLTSSAVTHATLDTGQGANELYDMDQNVLTSSSPTFVNVTVATEAYDATGWNGDLTAPTKDGVRDKIESMAAGGAMATDVLWDAAGDLAVGSGANTGVRLARGSALQVLRVNSGGTNLEWSTVAGSGDVTKVGTPVNNQVGVWTGDGTLEGTSALTFDGSMLSTTGSISATLIGATLGAEIGGPLSLGGDISMNGNDITDVGTLEIGTLNATTLNATNFQIGGVAVTATAAELNKLDATGTADSTTFLRGDATWAIPPVGGFGVANHAQFAYNATTTEPPVGSQIRLNNATQTAATRMWIAQLTTDSLDITTGLARILAGHQIYMQDRDSAANWVKYTVSAPGTDDGAYFDFTVVYHSGPGGIPAGQAEIQSLAPNAAGSGLASTDIDTSAELDTIVTDDTGSGALVFATSPTLVTPALGTPSALTLTNATGLPIAGIANIATSRVLGRQTAGTGAVEELTGSNVLDMTGSNNRGAILRRGFSTWGQLDPGAAGTVLTSNGAGAEPSYEARPAEWAIAVSDETTALTAGTGKVTFRMPYAMTLTAVRASVTTAATGGTLLTVDINEAGTTILSTKLTFDASEKTTTTAATAAVISDAALADDAEITVDIDAIGSTIAGAGLKILLKGTR